MSDGEYFPHNLTELTLTMSQLEDDPMVPLENCRVLDYSD